MHCVLILQVFHTNIYFINIFFSLNEVEITHALSQIPLFIEAYCFIGREYDEIFHQLRETIEHEVGLMMIYFPRMVYDLRLRCVNAFEHLLWVFYLKGRGTIQKFVSKSCNENLNLYFYFKHGIFCLIIIFI